jgi:class 3 adenylate cyclase
MDVNIASRVESVGQKMAVTISGATKSLLPPGYRFHSIGLKKLKGLEDHEVFVVERSA